MTAMIKWDLGHPYLCRCGWGFWRRRRWLPAAFPAPLLPVSTSGTAQVHGVQTAPAKDDQQGGEMTSGINRTDAWYIAVIIACGFITFYSLPDVTPFSWSG